LIWVGNSLGPKESWMLHLNLFYDNASDHNMMEQPIVQETTRNSDVRGTKLDLPSSDHTHPDNLSIILFSCQCNSYTCAPITRYVFTILAMVLVHPNPNFLLLFLSLWTKNFLGDPGHCEISPSLQTRITHHAWIQNVFQRISNTTDNLCKSHAFPECKINLIYTRKTNFSPHFFVEKWWNFYPPKKQKTLLRGCLIRYLNKKITCQWVVGDLGQENPWPKPSFSSDATFCIHQRFNYKYGL
jgi:hypothetical protein